MAIYNINVQYLPGKKNCFLKILSGDFIDNFGLEDKLVNNYVHTINTKKVNFRKEKRREFLTEISLNCVLSKILLSNSNSIINYLIGLFIVTFFPVTFILHKKVFLNKGRCL